MSSSRPIPNSYALPTGVGFAGQYPGDVDDDAAREKIGALIDAGVRVFIDLTEPDEPTWGRSTLRAYAGLVDEEAARRGVRVEHRRFAIPDMRAPRRFEDMTAILDAIDAAEAEGKRVYVHCWGGKGRTGTVANCHLIRRGWEPARALDTVQALAREMPRAVGARIPESEEQRRFVGAWAERERPASPREAPPAGTPSREERYLGALLGLAVGDAIGGAVEFMPPGAFAPVTEMTGGGPHALAPGEWTDDTSMALCLAESLVERGGFDAHDQMTRYLRWRDEGHWSSKGHCFDIGLTIGAALRDFARTGNPYAGPTAEDTAGNGSLMRLAPVPLWWSHDPAEAIARAAESSRTTNGAPQAVDACRWFAALIVGALGGAAKEELLAPRYAPVPDAWAREPLHPAVDAVAAGSWRGKRARDLRASGYVVHTLEAALWAFATTDSFEAGVLAAVNLGEDADTTGAVFGQLAGAYYGVRHIPDRWRGKLARRDGIARLALALMGNG